MRRRILMVLVAVALALAVVGPIAEAGAIFRAPPQPSSTSCVHLSGWLGKSRPGTNGQTFTPIFLRNEGSRSCSVSGVPRLIYNDDTGIGVAVRLGLSAARVSTAHRGGTVALSAHGGTANVLLWFLPTRYWSAKSCQPTRILSAHVEFGPKNVGVLVRTSFDACSKFDSTSITGVAAKSTHL